MVTVVVVTFNRKELLLNLLSSLRLQYDLVKDVVIIDNASTDGTYEYLKSNDIFIDKKIIYKRQNINEGGSGGFHEGIKLAFEMGAEWIWVMDDDIEWRPGALEYLLSFKDKSMMIQPSKEYSDRERYIWEGWFDDSSGRTYWKDDQFYPDREFVEVNYACFEGMLMHRSIVSKIGFPDKRFFLTNDDLIYGWLASFHTKVLYAGKPVMIKKIHEKNKKQPMNRSPYYIVRNQFLVIEYLKNYSSRFSSFKSHLFLILKTVVVLFRARSIFQIRLIFKGFIDGISRRFYSLQL